MPPNPHFMQLALEQAQLAAAAGEVPVGAVLVAADGVTVLGQGHNVCITHNDPAGHAEMVALRQAAQATGNYRLEGCTLYVTLEPCTMCSGAMLHARLARVVYAVPEPKTGAAGSVLNVFAQPFNHQTQVQQLDDVALQQACAALLQGFFQGKREEAKPLWPLRDDALRTPEQRFEALGLPEAGQYLNVDGLRLHYQEYHPTGEQVLLLLHASPFWGYAYYDAAQQAAQAGWRVLVPDWLGFGRSDKPKKARWYSVAQQAQALQQLLVHLSIPKAYYAGQGLGVAVAQALPELLQPCSQGNWQVSALTQQPQHPVWQAPYPDKGHQAALQVFKARM